MGELNDLGKYREKGFIFWVYENYDFLKICYICLK